MSILRSIKWAFAAKEGRIRMVEESNDQKWLAKVAVEPKEIEIRKVAFAMLTDQDLLAHIVLEDKYEKTVKIIGINYEIDLDKGTAIVGENYYKNSKKEITGNVNGDVIIESSFVFKKKRYTVIGISDCAFLGCDEVTSIFIPSSIETIGTIGVFPDYELFQKIIIANNCNKYTVEEGVLFTKNMDTLICYPAGKPEAFYKIPSMVKVIFASAFYGCINLEKIILPSSLLEIQYQAFDNCEFNSIILPSSLKSIGEGAFTFCWNLEKITIPYSCTEIGEEAFSYCDNLKQVIFENDKLVTPISTFKECDNLTQNNIIYSKTRITEPLEKSNRNLTNSNFNLMMECPPFPGRVVCSDSECPCDNTTMPPAKGYLYISREVAEFRKNCLSMRELEDIIRRTFPGQNITGAVGLPTVVCERGARLRRLNLEVAANDYDMWVRTSKVPCRATPKA